MASSFEQWFAQYGLWASYILIIAGIVAILLFTVYHLVQDPKKSLPSILGVVAIIIVFLITYASASEVSARATNIGPTMVKMIGGGIITLYILAAIAIIGIIVGEVWALFK